MDCPPEEIDHKHSHVTYIVSRLNKQKYNNSLSCELFLLQHLMIGEGRIKLKYLFRTYYIWALCQVLLCYFRRGIIIPILKG